MAKGTAIQGQWSVSLILVISVFNLLPCDLPQVESDQILMGGRGEGADPHGGERKHEGMIGMMENKQFIYILWILSFRTTLKISQMFQVVKDGNVLLFTLSGLLH